MQNIFLSFQQRVTLWLLVGNHQVSNLREASVHLRIVAKVRPTDRERMETSWAQDTQSFGWRLPTPLYGQRDIELEDEEAAALAQAIEQASPVRVSDAEWLTG